MCVGLVAADLYQRFVVAPWIRLRPDRRIPALGRWQQLMAWFVLSSARRIGGAKVPGPPISIPSRPGHLILMNHQSLFDIPLVVQTITGGYPRIVTRARYGRSIPLISHMTRLYQYPMVDPSANREALRKSLESLEIAGRESDVPLVVFPEGARSRDGEIGRFRSAGLAYLLQAREWTVHVLVADGFWRAGRFRDLVRGMDTVDGKVKYAGALEWTDPSADPGPFIREARRLMVDALAELRGQPSRR
jgi:1-acyl-sn-glycerol-3-phosphate acyltransferase